MLHALSLALGQLFDRRILTLLGLCTLLSLATFVGLWWLIDWLLTSVLVDTGAVQTVLDWLGALAAILAAWFLFPVVISAFIGLFLERIAHIVETRHYPDLPPAAGLPFFQSLMASLQFLGVVLAANVLLLLLWLFPIAYPIAFLIVNGLLIGHEYFALVALRRLDRSGARTMRQRHGSELLLTGAGITFLLTVPVVNLITPVLATAAMVHRFEHWRRREMPQAGGG